MENARRVPSDRFHSIHLVPKNEPQASLSAGVQADRFHLLPREWAQRRIMKEGDSPEAQVTTGDSQESQRGPALNAITVLRELIDLLEDYSPVWYSEEQHDRAVAALKCAIQ